MAPKPTYEDLQRRVKELEKPIAELRETETALRITELWRERIFNSLEEAVFVVTPDRKLINVNDGALRMFGYSREELASLSTTVFHVDQDHYVEFGKIIQVAFDRGEPANFEFEVKRKNGEIFPSEHTVTLLKGDQGEPLGIVSVVRDVTERKQYERELEKRVEERTAQLKLANEELREREERLRTITDSALDSIFCKDINRRYTFVNLSMIQLMGCTEADLIGKVPEEVFDKEDAAIVAEVDERTLKGENISEVRSLFIAGKRYTFHTIQVPLHDADGNITGISGIVRDITDFVQAEEALRKSEEKYRSMMEAMKDPIYICSPDFRVEYMNPAMIRRTGREATGEFCFKALHDLEEKCPWCMHEKAQQGEYSEIDIVSPKDGRFYYISCAPIVYRDGFVSRLTVWKDTTNLRTLETQLQQAQKMEAIGTLAGGIAHDFNNILGGIMGYAELAKIKALEGSNVIVDLEQLIKSSKRATDLVKQILTISRQHKQEQRPVQVRYIVNEALNLLRATLPTTIEIREDLAKDAGIVNADPTQIHQVIMNLGTNAGHAMQEDGGVLEVSLANVELDDLSVSKHLDLNAGFYLRLTLSDTGYGMTAEIMERIFDPYFTTKDTGEGTGLGLSVAQGIVKAHGGTIAVYSELGKGATFHVYLPVILEEETEEKESEEPLPTGSERILFIDDEQVLIDIARQMLKQLKYTVVTRQSSLKALELFRTAPDRFDLVITDMTMPHMTGDKLARELMEIRPDIPVILCTGHSRLVSKEKAKEIGLKAFVMKPLVMRDLAETVRKVLDKK